MLRIHKTTAPFCGTITLPGDKSISHRAALFAALSDGACKITGFLESGDSWATLHALEQLGATIEHSLNGEIVIHGRGGFFQKPSAPIYCGNSGTTMRLLAGVLASQPFFSELRGDASLSQRPMQRLIEPLRSMGAQLQATGVKQHPPLFIEGAPLRGVSYTLPVASAQVKSAILLAALAAQGETILIETVTCRDHTERMLSAFQVPFSSLYNAQNAHQIKLQGPHHLKAQDLSIPGDISSAAFWIAAAAVRPGSSLCLKNVGLNPTRLGFLTILERMGARLAVTIKEEINNEPRGDINVEGASLFGTIISGHEIPNVIDELPILAVTGALAHGTTLIKDAEELRFKETDRITAIVNNLRAMDVTITEYSDGLKIKGGCQLQGATIPSYGDHRIAMAFSIAGLFAEGTTFIQDSECIATSYPGFETTLEKLITAS